MKLEKTPDLLGALTYSTQWKNPPREELYTKNNKVVPKLCTTLQGAYSVDSGPINTCLPEDKYIVNSNPQLGVDWGGYNQPMSEDVFDYLQDHLFEDLKEKKTYLIDAVCGRGGAQLHLRVVATEPWQAHFIQNQFHPASEALKKREWADLTIAVNAEFQNQDYLKWGMNSPVFIAMHLEQACVLIGGTGHLGEIKKAAFSFFNYKFLQRNQLPLHGCCIQSKTTGRLGLLLGSSGVGKTTVALQSECNFGGDDELLWNKTGVENLEAGCYVKMASARGHLTPMLELWAKRDALFENAALGDQGEVLWEKSSHIENSRVSIPLSQMELPQAEVTRHPQFLCLLTKDAFGVFPPIARLSKKQFLYHYLSGYSTKIVKSESGIHEAKVRFSPCYAGPYLLRSACEYLAVLEQKIKDIDELYLLNTGWMGGALGFGRRINDRETGLLVEKLLSGAVKDFEWELESFFGFEIPKSLKGIELKDLNPERTWQDLDALQAARRKMSMLFHANFERLQCEDWVGNLQAFAPQI